MNDFVIANLSACAVRSFVDSGALVDDFIVDGRVVASIRGSTYMNDAYHVYLFNGNECRNEYDLSYRAAFINVCRHINSR